MHHEQSGSADTFGAYMESDWRETAGTPALAKMAELSTDPGAICSGNRVYDER